jgi:hypothetical protein
MTADAMRHRRGPSPLAGRRLPDLGDEIGEIRSGRLVQPPHFRLDAVRVTHREWPRALAGWS